MEQTLQKQILRGIWVVLCTAALLFAIYKLFPLVSPFLIGWAIAYLLNPAVNLLQRRARFPRWLAVTLSLLVFLGITIGIIVVLITNIAIEINSLALTIQENIDNWKNTLVNYVNSDAIQSIINRFSTFYAENPQYQETIRSNLSSTAKSLANFGSTLVAAILNGIVAFITTLPSKATITIIALLAAFFISKDWYKIMTKGGTLFPEKVSRATRAIRFDLQKALFGYLRAQLILISITAVVVTIGLIVLHVEYAVTIGLLFGLVDLLPYLGTGAAMIPWILVLFIQGNLYLGVGLSVLYGIVLVVRQLVEPKVLATSLGLEPLPLLIAIFVGLKLLGVAGLFAGPVTLIILFALQRASVFRDMRSYIVHGRFMD